jgi:hypothetical protein
VKCIDCQFNLLCHAGRLDSWSKDQQSIVMLCPKCNRLSVGHHETLRIFECELRRLGGDALEAVEQAMKRGDLTVGSSVQIQDPGPGLIGKLTLAFCPPCMDVLPPQMRKITIEYLDENRTETLEKQVAQQRAEAISAEEDEP